MLEARRASIALATLIALSVAAVVLAVPPVFPQLSANVARMCRLPGIVWRQEGLAVIATPAWVLVALLLGGGAFALVRLARALRSSRRIVVSLATARPPAVARATAARVAARAAVLHLPFAPVVADLEGRPAAFTVGLRRPRIVLTNTVADALADAELDALLLHEATHARRRDPLRLLVAGFCRDLLFFLPIGHVLFRVAVEAQERAADDAAAARTGAVDVASALLAFLKLAGRANQARLAAAAGGGDPEARIRRLLGTPDGGRSRWISRARAGLTFVVSAALLVSFGGIPARAAEVAMAGCCAAMTAGPVLATYC